MGGSSMVVIGIIAAILIVYLGFVLVKPEKF
ncbi:potassium-transporting ATPase subunit F [Paenibacillus sp. SYP-B3998]|uniref:Potassium-transporting ATPase subunit F n=1 Tax=Paenibacillus sp. SYP-B3998 TaxID=2678564 RepID=A0A6G4A1Q8_9BACL|nr:potassium-transporting ATPase subunit F [Paenibacillus sp. SYP-B3998]